MRRVRGGPDHAAGQDADGHWDCGCPVDGPEQDEHDAAGHVGDAEEHVLEGVGSADLALIRQVRQYMRDWFLGKVIGVADPRVLLGEQPPVPARGARGYIIGGNRAPDPRT